MLLSDILNCLFVLLLFVCVQEKRFLFSFIVKFMAKDRVISKKLANAFHVNLKWHVSLQKQSPKDPGKTVFLWTAIQKYNWRIKWSDPMAINWEKCSKTCLFSFFCVSPATWESSGEKEQRRSESDDPGFYGLLHGRKAWEKVRETFLLLLCFQFPRCRILGYHTWSLCETTGLCACLVPGT